MLRPSINWMIFFDTYTTPIASWAESTKKEWTNGNHAQRSLLAIHILLATSLTAAPLTAAFLDSTHLTAHLLTIALLTLLLVGVHRVAEAMLWRLLARDRRVDDQLKEEQAGRWQGHAILFAFYTAATYLPFSGIPKGILSLLVLTALLPIATLIFSDIYHEAYLIIATIAFTVFTTRDYLHWLPCIPILAFLWTWTARTLYSRHLSGKYTSIDGSHRPGFKLFKTAISVIICAVMVGACLPWIFLSTNASWVNDHDYSKFQVIQHFPTETNLNIRLIKSISDLTLYSGSHKLTKPLVIKPNVCTYASNGVQVCHDYQCLHDYVKLGLAVKPKGFSWVIQDYCPHEEAVIFYYRYPYLRHGFIKHIGIREDAKQKEAGLRGIKLKAIFKPTKFVQPSVPMSRFFDSLADTVPGFTGGRYDVILEHGLEGALAGKGIRVLEAETFFVDSIDESRNGTEPLLLAASKSIRWCRTMALEFWAGIANIMVGETANIFKLFTRVPFLYRSIQMCAQV